MGPHRVSEEEYEQAAKRLRAVRRSLYAENEEKAIENSHVEHWRRENEAWRERQKQEAEKALLAKAFPWVRRLWEEDKGEEHWGYGIFVDPGAFLDEEETERYMCRRDGVLFHARGAIGAGSSAIGNMWRLQKLNWPVNATADDGEKEGGSQTGQQSDGKYDGSELAAGEHEETDEKRAAEFQKLREHFKSIRDRVPKKQRREQTALSGPAQAERGGLQDGILQNVFLIVDKSSAGSVLSGHGLVDDMWVWAADPDYDDAKDASAAVTAAAAATEGSMSAETHRCYKGFMRVRLQQLINNFYDARRFHENDCPMPKLWEAAQKSKHRAFVSLKDDEARSWSIDRFVGSAMRAQPRRIVYGPRPVVSAGTGVM